MSPQLVTYPTWQEMFGSHPTEAHLDEQIQPLDKLHTLWLLARINLLLTLDRLYENERQTAKLQTYLVNLLIDEELFSHLKRRFGRERLEDRQPFHSLQILTLMKRVVIHAEPAGGLRPDMDKAASYRLGRALIMANDFLFTPENLDSIRRNRPSQTKRRLALQLQVGSGLEINNPPAINTSIVRSEIMFRDILSKALCSLDIRGTFKRQSGLELEDYVDHILGLLTFYVSVGTERILDDPGMACINPTTFFAESPAELVKRFWKLELTSLEDLEISIKQPSGLKPYHDFIALRKKPLLEVEGANVIPMHLGFVQEKLEAGLFWTIFNSLETAQQRLALFTDWGHLFEGYVSQIFTNCCKHAEQYFAFPKFSGSGDEAFDGILLSSKYCVVMEYKGGFLTAPAKYAENEEDFVHDIDRKFGRDKGSGIEQLARKIGATFAGKTAERKALAGVDLAGVRVVIPVLVVQEAFISSEVTASYLADVFGSEKRKRQLRPDVTYTFPIVLDLSELETIKPYLSQNKISFAECLMERVRVGSTGFLSFRDFFREYLERLNIPRVRDDETIARFRQIMNRISMRFFRKPFEPIDKTESNA